MKLHGISYLSVHCCRNVCLVFLGIFKHWRFSWIILSTTNFCLWRVYILRIQQSISRLWWRVFPLGSKKKEYAYILTWHFGRSSLLTVITPKYLDILNIFYSHLTETLLVNEHNFLSCRRVSNVHRKREGDIVCFCHLRRLTVCGKFSCWDVVTNYWSVVLLITACWSSMSCVLCYGGLQIKLDIHMYMYNCVYIYTIYIYIN